MMRLFRHLGLRLSRLLPAITIGIAAAALQGCATFLPTDIDPETTLQANEGLVTFRLVNLDNLPAYVIRVKQVDGKDVYQLGGVKFGQTGSFTFIGRLPAGRYEMVEMLAWDFTTSMTSPLTERTGKFDVQPGKATDLGTLIYVRLPENFRTGTDEVIMPVPKEGSVRRVRFAVAHDQTPVPVAALLTAKFPRLSRVLKEQPLGWVHGTVPTQRSALERYTHEMSDAGKFSRPVMLGTGRTLAGGALGVVFDQSGPGTWKTRPTGTVHQLESVLVLKDGRWVTGGEEGYVAISDSAGESWRPLAGLAPGEIVVHLSQTPAGTLHMVTMQDEVARVYASPAEPVEWKLLRRIPGDASGMHLRYSAVSTDERLVVHTTPDTLTTLDYKTGQWDTQKTPRRFLGGMKATRDGYVVGVLNGFWMWGSLDYGKTWERLEGWVNSSMPEFLDRRRGFVVAAETGLTGVSEHKMHRTEDGGRTWTTGGFVGGRWPWLHPLWAEADGSRLYTVRHGRIAVSTDNGRTWD